MRLTDSDVRMNRYTFYARKCAIRAHAAPRLVERARLCTIYILRPNVRKSVFFYFHFDSIFMTVLTPVLFAQFHCIPLLWMQFVRDMSLQLWTTKYFDSNAHDTDFSFNFIIIYLERCFLSKKWSVINLFFHFPFAALALIIYLQLFVHAHFQTDVT